MGLNDEELAAAAAECEECTGWLEHCHAECCRDFSFAVSPSSEVEYGDATVRVLASVTDDVRRYLELHGAVVDGDHVTVPSAAVSAMRGRLVVRMPCHALTEDDLCALHDGRQPLCCSEFTRSSAQSGRWIVPPNCRFALKHSSSPSADGEPSSHCIS
jgi:hypothetical protein